MSHMARASERPSVLVIPDASASTEVLLVHAPYPGRLKFDGVPSSLLHAVAPFAWKAAEEGRLGTLGLLDPRVAGEAFLAGLGGTLSGGRVRVVCFSSSTAAIEETARAVGLIRELAGDDVFVIAGGPHEDGCDVKMAAAIPGVDLSIGGDAELLLDWVLRHFLEGEKGPEEFCEALGDEIRQAKGLAGRVEVTSPWWKRPATRSLDFGPLKLDELPPRPWPTRKVTFPVFDAPETLPLMVSRGCSYGRCAFCSEPSASGGQVTLSRFGWVEDVLERSPGAAVYFQDSIFPMTGTVRANLLPLLRESDLEWGCQVYLPRVTREVLRTLAEHGCRYVYTGIESASVGLLEALGKVPVGEEEVRRRLGWTKEFGLKVGVSLLFGVVAPGGDVLETPSTVEGTVRLADQLVGDGIKVAGFYPNVETLLPGTKREHQLRDHGVFVDFYRVPRSDVFADLEDGGVGYNFMTLPKARGARCAEALATAIAKASRYVVALGGLRW